MSEIRDVVVVIPGITGSVLEQNGKEVWGMSSRAVFEGVRTFGRSLRALAITGPDDPSVDNLDGVVATKIMPDLHFLPGMGWKIDGYGKVSSYLKQRWQLVEGKNFFAFPYDWRRDNRVAARQLERHSHVWLSRWREGDGPEDAKLVFVAHSMGGLVARYAIEVLGGWRETRALISIGTPFYGSLNAVDFLANGIQRGIGPFKADLTPLVQSFTSVHQLVPVYKCVQKADGETTTPSAAGIPVWKPAWKENLDGFYSEIEGAAKANRADPQWEEAGMRFVPIVGTDQPTKQSAVLDASGGVTMVKTFGGKDRGGDGTVPRISAALSGTQDVRMFSPEQHGSLQNLAANLGHIAGVVESFDELMIEDVRGGLLCWFAFEGADVYATGDSVAFEISLVTDLPEWQLPELSATVIVTNKDTGAQQRFVRAIDRERRRIDVGALPAGAYSVEVAPPETTDSGSVRDVFVVVDDDDEDEGGVGGPTA